MKGTRNQYYRYNAATDNFERVFPTIGQRLGVAARFLAFATLVGALIFLLFWTVWGSPGERKLREENAALKQQYELLNRRIDNSQKVLEQIRNRDDNFYRVMLQMEPMDDSQRNAGINNEKRYRELRTMSDGGLMKFLTQRVDLLERQIYAQSLSFDQIKETAVKGKGKLNFIPSILPLQMSEQSLAAGYGMRRDPVTEQPAFHPGIDIAAPEGTEVRATADGTILSAERRNMHGNMVEIDHGYNYITRYTHLDHIAVEAGRKVSKGDVIGTVGNTGRSTAPHLHYEVRFRGEAQNPVNFFFGELGPEEYSKIVRRAENAADVMD